MTKQSFISEFLDNETINALTFFLENESDFNKSANLIANAFGYSKDFSSMSEESISKLLVSFKNNLTLLIQKTWVEKSDIALKDQLLFQLDQLLKDNQTWLENYGLFRQIINQAVFLMFGQPTDSDEFTEYTLRIDPEFGIFWWYISNLPDSINWAEEKCKIAMLLGMYFLANY